MKKIKVTIIDDEIDFLNDFAKGLEILGYEVSKAASGSHAIEVINREKPDVALCDYKMDDIEGTQVIKMTKPDNPGTIYIILTAYYDESFDKIFKDAGATEVMYKPIQFKDVDDMIKRVLSQKKIK